MDDLEQRLRALEGSTSYTGGVTTKWRRNPDGPEAADRIAHLTRQLEIAREALIYYTGDDWSKGDPYAIYADDFGEVARNTLAALDKEPNLDFAQDAGCAQ